ncbi:MAG: hypothetical protein ACFFKA_13925 [Candidatus Thorarchaeota archaeon]
MLSDEVFIRELVNIVIYFFIQGILGLFFIFQGRKTKAKLLFYYGLGIVGFSVIASSSFIDFTTILITGNNMDGNLNYYLTWTPVAFITIIQSYVFAEILLPKQKWYLLSLILTVNVFYLLDLCIFHWTPHIIVYPAIPGEDLIQAHHARCRPDLPVCQIFPFRYLAFVNSYSLIFGVGFLYKALGIKGIFRKKYFYLSISVILFSLSRILKYNMVQIFGFIAGVIFTIIDFKSFVFSYLGLRAEPEQSIKKVKKKITTKDSLFRIIERPEQITEEEVTYYREQKICLVCKGGVGGFNTYICTGCGALSRRLCSCLINHGKCLLGM